MDAHANRLLTLSRDLAEQLQAGNSYAAQQTLTALRARLDLISRALLPITDAELSEVTHG